MIFENEGISILMCLYHKDKPIWLTKNLESILKQTYLPEEIILIVDGQIGNDLESILQKFIIKLPLKIFRNSSNMGLAYSLNRGIGLCNNNYIARVDSDDILTPDRLQKQIRYMLLNPKTSVLGGSVILIDSKGGIIGKRIYPTTFEEIKKGMWRNTICHSAVMFKKADIISIGGYNSKLRRGQDYDLWFRMLKQNFVLENLDEIVGYFRHEPNDFYKSSFLQKLDQVKIGIKGTRDLKLSLWKQIICIVPLMPYFLPKPFGLIYLKIKNFIHNR